MCDMMRVIMYDVMRHTMCDMRRRIICDILCIPYCEDSMLWKPTFLSGGWTSRRTNGVAQGN